MNTNQCTRSPSGRKSRIRIGRGPVRPVDSVVQVRRSSSRIAGVSNEAQHLSRRHSLPSGDRCEAIEVSVVMPFPTRSEHAHHVAAETIRPDRHHDPGRRADHRRSATREDVDAAMLASAGARGVPTIPKRSHANTLHRNEETRRRLRSRKSHREQWMLQQCGQVPSQWTSGRDSENEEQRNRQTALHASRAHCTTVRIVMSAPHDTVRAVLNERSWRFRGTMWRSRGARRA
jgi:hypothetical protein